MTTILPRATAERMRAAARPIIGEGGGSDVVVVVDCIPESPPCAAFSRPSAPAWPSGFPVPLRPVLGLRDAPVGVEEGELCLRDRCLGVMELRPRFDLGGCQCWRAAPCSSCMSVVPECTECGFRVDEP